MRLALSTFAAAMLLAGSALAAQPHNLILFVPDGLRALMVTPENAPVMAALRDAGVDFTNPHSLFPTFTTANASAMATGHYLGDTGDFSNTIYTGFPVPGAGGSLTPFLESDPVLGDVDEHFEGDYLDEVTILKAARAQGFSTATVGKLGPSLIFDHTDRTGGPTIVIDDSTGSPKGIPLSDEMQKALTAAGLPLAAPSRGANGDPGDFKKPGTTVANVVQQDYFAASVTKVVLPMFKARGKPFVLVFWSRDPDGSQHNQGDSLNQLNPGINGPTSLAGIRNADTDLGRLRDAVKELGLADTTDIVVSADHGFSTISKESKTSAAAKASYADVPPGFLPPGFLAIDLAKATGLPLLDPDNKNAPVADGTYPKFGNGLIGPDPMKPQVVVAANGGSDLVYFPGEDTALVRKVVAALEAEDYVSGLFIDDALGHFPGTLTLTSINLRGSAIVPIPAIAVNFRTWAGDCTEKVTCEIEIADTRLQQGQGMHGSFGRGDTMNFQAAIGPDFKSGFKDSAPTSNADIGKTVAQILGLDIPDKGKLVGRVLNEAMPNGTVPQFFARSVKSDDGADHFSTQLDFQTVGETRYFDAAGTPGRTFGLTGRAGAVTQ
jgi:arylsulfatase A-like enzyme